MMTSAMMMSMMVTALHEPEVRQRKASKHNFDWCIMQPWPYNGNAARLGMRRSKISLTKTGSFSAVKLPCAFAVLTFVITKGIAGQIISKGVVTMASGRICCLACHDAR